MTVDISESSINPAADNTVKAKIDSNHHDEWSAFLSSFRRPVSILSPEGNLLSGNERFWKLTGLERPNGHLHPWQDLLHSAELPVSQLISEAKERSVVYSGVTYHGKNGDVIHSRVEICLLPDAKKLFAVFHLEDDSESRFAIGTESESYLEMAAKIGESVPNIVHIFDLRKKSFVYISPQVKEKLGYSAREIIDLGKEAFDTLIHPEDRNAVQQRLFTRPESSSFHSVEFRARDKNGAYHRLRCQGRVFTRCENNLPRNVIGFTEEVERPRQLRDAAGKFPSDMREGTWRIEFPHPIPLILPLEEQVNLILDCSALIRCSDLIANIFGFDSAEMLADKSFASWFLAPGASKKDIVNKFVADKYQIEYEMKSLYPSHKRAVFLSDMVGVVENGCLVKILGSHREMTSQILEEREAREREERQRGAQKIEAIGRLAGGIAHDFNNFLAVIMLHVDMLDLQLPPDSSLRYRVTEIKKVTNNAASMVRQLLAFSRRQTQKPLPMVLNQIVRDNLKFLQALIGEDFELRLRLNESLGVCSVDSDQMTQIMMNLIVNSRDAMPSGGVITISTRNVRLTDESRKHKAQPPDDYIELCITDTGVGMDSKTRERIFEPFFTTKDPSKGTGLGLATVYGIVKQSNGFIWVDTKPNRGTKFMIHFPRIDQPIRIATPETAIEDQRGVHETVLIVEDEEQILRAAVEVLTIFGFNVLEASDGEHAIEVAEDYTGKIDVVLTDVVMPRANGREVAERIHETHPEASVLFMSGYTHDIISKHGVIDAELNFIEKPFAPAALVEKIRELIAAKKAEQ